MKRYRRLFSATLAFCRWAASAPPIRIWSTERVAPEAPACSWLGGFALAATKGAVGAVAGAGAVAAAVVVVAGCDRGAFPTFGRGSGVIWTSAPSATRL